MQSVPTLAQHVGAMLAQRRNIVKITLAQRWPTDTIMVGIMLGQCWQRFLFMVCFGIDKTDTLRIIVRLVQRCLFGCGFLLCRSVALIAPESLTVLWNPKNKEQYLKKKVI